MKLKILLEKVTNLLETIDSEKHEAELIFSEVLGVDRAHIFLSLDRELTEIEEDRILNIVSKRINREPIQYIFGYAYFFGEKFHVNRNVLIPRFDSEIIVEYILSLCRDIKSPSLLEVGVGSGALSIVLAKNLGITIDGVDICDEALRVAQKNADDKRVVLNLMKSDIFESVKGKYDIIFSNPPYISEEEYKQLKCEVRKEPKKALVSPEKGLYFYERIIPDSLDHLNENGILVLEIGYNQGVNVKKIAERYFKRVSLHRDLNGVDRMIVCSGVR